GAAAIVLIAITLWIVWPSRAAEAGADAAPEVTGPDTMSVAPDEYTSATADLSAGGVATTIAVPEPPTPPATVAGLSTFQTPPEPAVTRRPPQPSVALAVPPKAEPSRGKQLGLGAAALLALGGGALLYARWQQSKRKRPKTRFARRRF